MVSRLIRSLRSRRSRLRQRRERRWQEPPAWGISRYPSAHARCAGCSARCSEAGTPGWQYDRVENHANDDIPHDDHPSLVDRLTPKHAFVSGRFHGLRKWLRRVPLISFLTKARATAGGSSRGLRGTMRLLLSPCFQQGGNCDESICSGYTDNHDFI
jgi:hypothetical protein